MSSTTYPNGQTLISSALTQTQVTEALQTLTCGALGLVPPDYSQVRRAWPEIGQPFQNQPQNIAGTQGAPANVTYVAVSIWNTPYSQVRDQLYAPQDPYVLEQWTYTKGWEIAWVFYGLNADDNARAVWSALTFMDYFSNQLNLQNLFVVTDPDAPVYAPENINGQWFPRADFSLRLYEQVTETILDGTATSVEIKLYEAQANPTGPVADFTVGPVE